jgi:hypothetical protein
VIIVMSPSRPAPRARHGVHGATVGILVGAALMVTAFLCFSAVIALEVADDDRFSDAQGALLGLSLLLGLVGTVVAVIAAVARIVAAAASTRKDLAARDAGLIAEMGRARTPAEAAAVQARRTSRSWRSNPLLILVLVCFGLVFVSPVLGDAGAVVLVAAFAALGAALIVLTRRRPSAGPGSWTRPAGPAARATADVTGLPPHVQDRIRAEHRLAAAAAAPATWQRALAERLGGHLPTDTDTAHLWRAHHATLLARETYIAGLATERGYTYQPLDRAADPDGHARNSLNGTHDGVTFLAHDRIVPSVHRTRNNRVTGVTLDLATVVQIPFAAPFRLAVLPDSLAAHLTWGHVGHPVTLESGTFNDAYNVYCIDPVRARLVLNPSVMAALISQRGTELLLDRGLLRLTRPGGLADQDTIVAMLDLAVRTARSARAAAVT